MRPDFLIGHSIGELAAAHVAGVFSLEDACRLVAARGRLMGALPAGGAMLAVAAPEAEVLAALHEVEDGALRLALAAVNGPRSVVVSGDQDAVLEVGRVSRSAGVQDQAPARLATPSTRPAWTPCSRSSRDVAGRALLLRAPAARSSPTSPARCSARRRSARPSTGSRHVREPCASPTACACSPPTACTKFLELGPDGVLSALVADGLEEGDGDGAGGGLGIGVGEGARVPPAALATLRPDVPEAWSLLEALAGVWVRGAGVDWERLFDGASAAAPARLPTYAFQRQRFWLSSGGGATDAAALGQASAEHPLLGASVRLANGGGWLFTGRLSLDSHAWLADHAVLDTVLLPGTAFVELALRAGAEVGCPVVGELLFEAPLALGERGDVHIQVSVGEPEESGARPLGVHACPDGHDGDWTRHASGTLLPASAQAADGPERVGLFAESWPPAGAVEVEIGGLYERLSDAGFDYGPAFQGLRGAWRRGEDLFCDVSLSEAAHLHGDGFGLHPALLDAAFHALIDARRPLAGGASDGGVHLPFSLGRLELHAPGAASLRVHLSSTGENEVSLVAVDESGRPVLSAASVVTRELSPERLASVRGAARDSLHSLEWTPVALPASRNGSSERCVLVDLECGASGVARGVLHEALKRLQEWLSDERSADSRLVFLTHRAVAAGDRDAVAGVGDAAAGVGDVSGLAAAGVWGLVRSAQSENPGLFGLIDTDDSDASHEALAAALALEEPQLALRDGAALVPRLARPAPSAPSSDGAPFGPDGTVLITGGTGGLGALVARHLVAAHGVGNLLLLSRRGPEAHGAPELQAELEALGAHVRILACDVSDREQLAGLIESLPAEAPLSGVVHAAGVLLDGVIASLTPARLDAVLAPKAHAAWHLHELTRHLPLRAFVLFSSASGLLGGMGQGNYAAANAYLDALAAHRRASGLAGVSIAWGQWALAGDASAMTGALQHTDLARLQRLGIAPLSEREGLELLDAACAQPAALAVPLRLDSRALRAGARAGALPPLLRGLVRPSAAGGFAGAGGYLGPNGDAGAWGAGGEEPPRASLAALLDGASSAEHEGLVLDLVLAQVATVLGHDSPHTLDSHAAFKDLGFDSLMAVELRNRLSAASGLRLAAGVLFDHPSPAALADHLHHAVSGEDAGESASLAAEIGGFDVAARIDGFDTAAKIDGSAIAARIDSADAEELFALIDNDLRVGQRG